MICCEKTELTLVPLLIFDQTKRIHSLYLFDQLTKKEENCDNVHDTDVRVFCQYFDTLSNSILIQNHYINTHKLLLIDTQFN